MGDPAAKVLAMERKTPNSEVEGQDGSVLSGFKVTWLCGGGGGWYGIK